APPREQPRPPSPDQTRAEEKTRDDRRPTDDKTPKDDPDSDSMPPQLKAIEFIPNVVQDGGETVLAVMASDNLSGIRSISGSIMSPTSAVQGFALMREGDSDRYITRIGIPKNAAE